MSRRPRKTFTERRERRRQWANARMASRSELSIKERLALCDSRPGNSTRERQRLMALLEKEALGLLAPASKDKKGKKSKASK
jgi:hypothetical protein